MQLRGVGIGRGIALGPVVRMPEPLPEPLDTPSALGVSAEKERAAVSLAATSALIRQRGERAGGTAKDVLDARAIPDMAGKPSLMITLTPAAAAAIHVAQGARVPCMLDGKPLGESPSDSLGSEHVLQLSGDFGDYTATSALARRISGRDPVPDSESDE